VLCLTFSDGDFPVRVSPLEEFLTPTLPPSVTVKDPSLQVLALLRLLHALSRYWGTLFEVWIISLVNYNIIKIFCSVEPIGVSKSVFQAAKQRSDAKYGSGIGSCHLEKEDLYREAKNVHINTCALTYTRVHCAVHQWVISGKYILHVFRNHHTNWTNC